MRDEAQVEMSHAADRLRQRLAELLKACKGAPAVVVAAHAAAIRSAADALSGMAQGTRQVTEAIRLDPSAAVELETFF